MATETVLKIEDVEKRTIVQVADVMRITDEIKKTDRLDYDINMDSLDRVEVVMAVEEEFDIMVDDETSEKWDTVEDIINTVAKARGF